MKFYSVAIDGPSGAGKSTLARRLASELNFLYVDTGAIYRTVALHVQKQSIDYSEQDKVTASLEDMKIRMAYGEDGLQRMYLQDEDVTNAIRIHSVSYGASMVAAIPEVRAFLLDYQRRMAREQNVVMDGRDIGTVVLPDADVKIFLTASAEIRARRRVLELEQRGQIVDFAAILHDVQQRDEQDRNRSIAPLRRAEDAVLLDTSEMDLEESLQNMLRIVREGFSE